MTQKRGSGSKPKGRKGKIGRNKHRIVAYYASGTNFWNKARRIMHHMRRYAPAVLSSTECRDYTARTALSACINAMPYHKQRQFSDEYLI